jgi:hypothetical protein
MPVAGRKRMIPNVAIVCLSIVRWSIVCGLIVCGLIVCVPFAGSAQAGVAFFRETCVAAMHDLAALEPRLLALGMTATNDQRNALLGHPKRTRTWALDGSPAQNGDSFVQILLGSGDEPFDICHHVSRPGENAVEALSQLQKLYPPIAGTVQRGTHNFYGGKEIWSAAIDGIEVVLEVTWPILTAPLKGTSGLILARPRPRSRDL